MGKETDQKKLAEAMEKLACHIEPPGHRQSEADTVQPASSCSADGPRADFIDENGKVLLTRMTAAGG